MPSRQYEYQQRKIAEGKCRICGVAKIFRCGMCEYHYIKNRKYQREYHKAWRKRNPGYSSRWREGKVAK